MSTDLEQFKTYLEVRDYSKLYYNPISIFLDYCGGQQYDYKNITLNKINEFLLHLKKQGKGNGYLNNFIKAIRFFYGEYLFKHNLCSEEIVNIVKNVKQLKTQIVIKEYITEEELNDIMFMAESYCTWIPYYKTRAILKFLFFTGLRKEEFLRLERKNIDLDKNKFIINTFKNNKEDYGYFPKHVKKDLEQYFKLEPEERNAFNISARQLQYLFKQLKDFAPSGKNLTPHTLRHSYAHLLIEKGHLDIRTVQKLMRHKSLQSTMIYSNVDDRMAEKAYKEKIK